MQDQVNEKTVALSVKAVKLTGRLLAQAMQAFMKRAREPTASHGKQSIKSLTKQGARLSNIEISGDNIASFRRTARKYNVDFALKRDDAEKPGRWLVFFKAKDADALTAAFNEYGKIQLRQQAKKPSLQAELQRAQELVAAPPAKNRAKGEREL